MVLPWVVGFSNRCTKVSYFYGLGRRGAGIMDSSKEASNNSPIRAMDDNPISSETPSIKEENRDDEKASLTTLTQEENSLKRTLSVEEKSNGDGIDLNSGEHPEAKKMKKEPEDQQESFNPENCKKRKVAVLLGYSGSGYFGMQKNPGVKTIEHDLVEAFYRAGAIKEDVKDDMGKMAFQRAARTDKGVSATRQVVSLKMIPNIEMIPRINKHLPSGIRVFDIKRVTRAFDSKNFCSARTYEYLLPSFAFAPTYMETFANYRIKDRVLEKVINFLKRYEGTHNFHNFTSGRLSTDASAHRYIIEFKASKPFVRKGHEFLILSVTGQSFMLHQIRKMIGLCIAYCRGHCNFEALDKAWGRNKVDIPKAPGLGLVLDMVHYKAYNKQFGNDGMHQPLTWEGHEEEINEFRERFIWSTIIDTEITQHSMMRWLATLTNHTYDEEGIIRSMQKKAEREKELANRRSDKIESLDEVEEKTKEVTADDKKMIENETKQPTLTQDIENEHACPGTDSENRSTDLIPKKENS